MYLNKIDDFKRYTKKPNTIAKGPLYLTTLKFKDEDKIIRVYLPYNYDFSNENKRFPTIYMFDGQNLVDEYTTAFGEWNIDEEITRGIKNKLFDGIIVVGIDSIRNDSGRMNELCPSRNNLTRKMQKIINKPYLIELGDFIINVVKPLIDKTFYTINNKENTLIGGSSMGGLASFYMGIKYPSIFNGILSFSPAFQLYYQKSLKEELKRINYSNIGKIYFYLGGVDFEKEFISSLNICYKELEKSMKKNNLKYIFDSTGIHHESSWQKYFLDAVLFLLK